MRRGIVLAGLVLAAALAGCASDEQRRDEHLRAAEAFLEKSQPAEALLELRSALKLDPGSSDINFQIAEALEGMGRLGDAVFFYGETMRLDPSRTDAAVKRAHLLIFDEPEEARSIIDGVLARDPTFGYAHLVASFLDVLASDYDAALAAALTAAELTPESPDPYEQVGKVHQAHALERRKNGEDAEAQFAAAAEAFRRAADLAESASASRNVHDLAKLLAAWEGHNPDAAAEFRRALDLAVENGEIVSLRAIAQDAGSFAAAVGNAELARDALEAVLSLAPDDLGAWRQLAALEAKLGRSEDAVYARLLEAQPGSAAAHVLYSRYLVGTGRADEGVRHLLDASAKEGEETGLKAELVNLYIHLGKFDEVAALVAELEAASPDDPMTVLAQAQLAIHQARPEDARTLLRGLVSTAPSLPSYQLLASLEFQLGDLRACSEVLEQAFAFGRSRGVPYPVQLFRTRARLHDRTRDWRGAFRDLGSLQRHGHEFDAEESLIWIRALHGIGRERIARQLLEKEVAVPAPSVEAVLAYVARVYDDDPEAVVAVLDRVLEGNPFQPALLAARARILIEEDKPQEALDLIAPSFELARPTPELLLIRARSLAALGNVEAAQRDAMAAFDADPSLGQAAALVVSLYRQAGREAEAIASFEQALAAGGLRPAARYLLAKLYSMTGDDERAKEVLEALEGERVEIGAVKNDLAYLLARDGEDLTRAVRLAQEARQRLPDHHATAHTLGYAYLQKGLYEPAVDQLREALALADESAASRPLYLLHLGRALEGLGRAEEAQRAYEDALGIDGDFDAARQAIESLRKEQAAAAS